VITQPRQRKEKKKSCRGSQGHNNSRSGKGPLGKRTKGEGGARKSGAQLAKRYDGEKNPGSKSNRSPSRLIGGTTLAGESKRKTRGCGKAIRLAKDLSQGIKE